MTRHLSYRSLLSQERKDFVRVTGLVLFAAAIGFGYTLYLFPMPFLAGSAPWWKDAAPQDVKQTLTGLRYFIADDWQFPIFRTLKVNPPEGLVIIYTDSIPLLAFVAKALRHIFGVHWNYLGFWVGMAYVLQAVSVVVLLLSLGVRTLVPCITAAVIALSFPSFLFRLFHTAEIGHFLVIFALSLYFFSIRVSSFHRIWPWFVVASWLALWIEAYIFVIVVAVFLAAAIQFALTRPNAWKQSTLALTVCLLGSVLLMWASGFFWGGGSPDGGGFGHYSMNVLSPWVPQWSGLFPEVAKIFGATRGPFKGRLIDATGGQYEGYNYLGAGVLFLFCFALWLDRHRLVLHTKKYWGLVLTLCGLTILALSNRLYIGKWEIVILKELPSAFDQIRSSGRFFWPVAYALLAVSVVVVARRWRHWKASLVLLLGMTLQIVDVAPVRNWVAEVAESGSGEKIARATEWRKLIAVHDRLIILPTFSCRGDLRGKVFRQILDLGFLASDSLTPINTTYVSRYRGANCLQESRDVVHLQPAEGDLVLLLKPYSEMIQTLSGDASPKKICRSFDEGLACSRRWKQIDELGWSASFSVPTAKPYSYTLGAVIEFSQSGNSAEYGPFGWLRPEVWGAWTYSDVAGLAVNIEKAVTSDLSLFADATAFVTEKYKTQRVEIAVNDRIIGTWNFAYGEADRERRVRIPLDVATRKSPMLITFYVHETKPIFDFRLYGDSRLLGLGMRKMRIVAETLPNQ